jgi:hypothetical protein
LLLRYTGAMRTINQPSGQEIPDGDYKEFLDKIESEVSGLTNLRSQPDAFKEYLVEVQALLETCVQILRTEYESKPPIRDVNGYKRIRRAYLELEDIASHHSIPPANDLMFGPAVEACAKYFAKRKADIEAPHYNPGEYIPDDKLPPLDVHARPKRTYH